MNGSLGHLRYSLARQLYYNFSRQSRKGRNESFHKLGSDKCFPTSIRSKHTVDYLPLTSRTNQFEAVEKLKRKFRAEISSKQRKLRMQAGRQAPAAVTPNDNSLRHVNKWVTHLPCSRICLNSLNGANHSELKQLWPFAKRIPAICFQDENISKAVRGGKQWSVALSCVFLAREAKKVNLFRQSVSQTLIRFYETS